MNTIKKLHDREWAEAEVRRFLEAWDFDDKMIVVETDPDSEGASMIKTVHARVVRAVQKGFIEIDDQDHAVLVVGDKRHVFKAPTGNTSLVGGNVKDRVARLYVQMASLCDTLDAQDIKAMDDRYAKAVLNLASFFLA